jgi:hypothetical protein
LPIHALLERSAFGPEEIKMIVAAFEDACRELDVPQGDPRREDVAFRTFTCAQTGVLDAGRLRDAGIGS